MYSHASLRLLDNIPSLLAVISDIHLVAGFKSILTLLSHWLLGGGGIRWRSVSRNEVK